ncbi:hypothetical protein ACFLQ0_03420 [Nitrospinota bacterium]
MRWALPPPVGLVLPVCPNQTAFPVAGIPAPSPTFCPSVGTSPGGRERGRAVLTGWTSNWSAAWGVIALAFTLAGVLGRIVYGELRRRVDRVDAGFRRQIEVAEAELRGRIVRAEGRIDEIHLRYARRDDIARELEGIRKAFAEVFSELRRANEGIAALRGGGAEE